MNLHATTIETEDRLITQAQRGDQEAFCELVRRHHKGTINVVYRMCGDFSLAEDAAQTAFLHAWEHLHGYHPHASFRSWLYRIAVNAGLDTLRKEKPATDLEEELLTPADGKLENLVEEQERREQVQRAVLALPAGSRAVLVLREYEGLSYHEIAQALDIPAGTVMSRLNYARTRLIELLRPYLEEA